MQKIREIKTKICLLKRKTKKMMSKSIVFSSFLNSLMQSTFASEKFLITSTTSRTNNALTSHWRTFKLDKIFLYHDKSIKKHWDYVRNLTTTFHLIFDDFSTKNFKIVYVMQFLAKKSKKIWYCFEKKNFDHEYIFEKYCEYLLNFVENSINH